VPGNLSGDCRIQGVKLRDLPDGQLQELDAETVAAIIRVTGGNFRLLGRLLTQTERILEINRLNRVTAAVIDAARESLVVGQL
jgi:DNA transposition AAA+ family ATPase